MEGQKFLFKVGVVHILLVQVSSKGERFGGELVEKPLCCGLFIFLRGSSNLHPSNQLQRWWT